MTNVDTIAAVITTFNSADTLARCLSSVAFCDEIIVLDSNSSDSSQAIAHSFGARVFSQDFRGYAQQKSDAIAKATAPWILLLDSDECLPPEAAVKVRSAMTRSEVYGYRMPRIERIFWRMQHPATRANDFLRLFRRAHAYISAHHVHESVVVNGPVARLDCAIWHDSDRCLAGKVAKLNQYSSLALQDWTGTRAPAAWRLTLYPLWYFLRAYLFKRQFLNGWAGYINSVELAHYAFLKYAKRFESKQLKQLEFPNSLDASKPATPVKPTDQ